MSDAPRLPSNLPASFGNDSPFPPPAASSRIPSARFLASASAPPLPPSRDEALERERQLRQRAFDRMQHPSDTTQMSSPSSGGLMPGQIIPSTAYARKAPVAASPQFRMVSPPMSPPMPAPKIRMPVPRTPRPPPKEPIQQQHQPRRDYLSSPLPVIQRPLTTEPRTRYSDQPAHQTSSMYPQRQEADSQRRRVNSDDGTARNLASQQREVRQQHPPARETASPVHSPELNVILPDLNALTISRERAFASANDKRKLAWCKDVIKYIERKSEGTKITDPLLVQYIDEAIGSISDLASTSPPLAEALYLRGDLLASGAFPAYHRKSLKQAFSDFELSARMGYPPSWFRIGRDYEILGDHVRAKDAYERGCAVNEVGCIYRVGMANLLGQLGLAMNHDLAIPILRQAADLVNLDTPQPSYIYGMLLAGEFSHVEVAPRLLVPTADPAHPNHPVTIESEAKRRIQRAAYLNFGPAQYRCGWSYEYALLECPFDPLLSVQYYSLASQAGEIEADLALSKWFLCGAEGCFDKNEGLAFTFAEKAARKGLPSAEFAMGYYFEVGVGCEKSINVAQSWYNKAASHGNTDAKERLTALQGPTPSSLSRTQHEVHVDTQLQRKRTEAKVKSDRRSKIISKEQRKKETSGDFRGAAGVPQRPTDVRRRMTMRLVEETAKKSHRPSRSREQNSVGNDFTGSVSEWERRESAPAPIVNPSRPTSSNRDRGVGLSRLAIPSTGHTPIPSPNSKPSPQASTRHLPKGNNIASSNSAPANLATKPTNVSDYSSSKKFDTFGEMGFSAKKTKDDKDCVIC